MGVAHPPSRSHPPTARLLQALRVKRSPRPVLLPHQAGGQAGKAPRLGLGAPRGAGSQETGRTTPGAIRDRSAKCFARTQSSLEGSLEESSLGKVELEHLRESGRLFLDVQYPQFWGTVERWGPPVQALSPGLETLHSAVNTISLCFNRVPRAKAGDSLQASACGCTAPAADLASLDLLNYLLTSQVGPPGKGQAPEPFRICPPLPFPCHLPAILRSLGF